MDIIDDTELFKTIINNTKILIDRNIYKFLFTLLYYIFILRDKSQKNDKDFKNLDKKIKEINDNYIPNVGDKINKNYNTSNLLNIVKFVKNQNNIYATEILENILIIIFSFGFKTERENTFGKYIYNNIHELKDKYKYELANWVIKNKIKTNSNIKILLENDFIEREQMKSKIQEEPLFDFLYEIYMEKENRKKILKKKIMNYINNRIFDFKNKYIQRINANKNITQNKLDSYSSLSSYSIVTNLFFCNKINGEIVPFGKVKKIQIPLIRSFLISVFIYYQNKTSNLMKYIKKSNNEENLEIIPFVYDLSEAGIENSFANVILSPLRVEPRINEIRLSRNRLKESGILEMAKVLIFNNKNIKEINFQTSYLKAPYIDFLNNRLGLFENHSIEVLNLSFNYLNENCSEYLANILLHLKKLKIINLSSNDFKSGISSFLITLKKLYRLGKTNIETLYLNKCLLDDIAYYELGELLKCKYCKLKNLYLNDNNIPSCSNFLKQLKKNRSLIRIYFNKNNICNNDTDDIMRVMSNTNIESLYLYKNQLSDFSQILRILYRTKLLIKKEIIRNENSQENKKENNQENYKGIKSEDNNKNKKVKIIRGESLLYNLDLSNNNCYNKNIDKLELLKQSIEDSTLYCLDISNILYNNFPETLKRSKDYLDFINNWNKELNSEQKKYNKTIGDINFNEIDKKRIIKEMKYNDLFEDMDNEIIKIIKNDKAKYILFLRKQADKLINENGKIKDEIINKDQDKYKEIHSNLVDYMNLKRINIKIEELKEIRNAKKMILI